ncbi:hypothetical protein GCM10011611_63860 [Aliidongia dinghuensis]|uniref:Uncharacterized protein n=1 Tax=Aliidongia dinghuensis TaxID=1867774 RepID=A0A8J3E6W0_9PROT|nr:hypothetical protein [Aliidongia dinghuensis]GGF48686.1 hypothetical protein GCM10011611_63860 [Aliidongia dinghuensis]
MIKGALVLPLALAFLNGCSSLPDWIAPASTQAPAASKSAAPPRQVASVANSVDNPTQNQLMSLPKRQQAAILAEAVGHGCQGVSPYFMGIGDDGSAIWSIRCARGHAWAVSISPGPAGDTTVKRCTSFAAETHLSCFSKF